MNFSTPRRDCRRLRDSSGEVRRFAEVRVPALFASVCIALAACGTDGGQEPAATRQEPASVRVLAHPPFLGVSCPGKSNMITCDRVGLAVWLSAPATALEASVGGKPVSMAIRPERAERKGRGKFFVGYLQPAGLSSPGPLHVDTDGSGDACAGGNPPSVSVRLVVHYPGGRSAVTTVRTELQPGWG
jgi:hypothetical protein